MTSRLLARRDQLLIGVAMLPFVVALVALVAGGGDYLPISDHAVTELRVRDIGSHEVVTGLYSRDDWSHPGPMFFYLLAPLYRLAGTASIAINLGALLLNGAAVAGMAYVARRRGGAPLALATLLVTSLLIRTLGMDFVSDPWNPFVTVLPFGLLVLLAWSTVCGDRWALPWAAATATFLAQTHVGFVALALPLAGLAAISLLVRTPDRRSLVRPLAVTVGVTAVLWSPVLVDVLWSSNNLGRVIEWFREAEDGTHTLAEGWRVISAQLALVPEWLTWHRAPFWATGESAFLRSAPFPLLLLPVAAAVVVLRRDARGDGIPLVATFAVTFVLGMIAVARTVGLVLDYRLRWTWIVGMVGGVVIAWAGWLLARRHAVAARVVASAAIAALVVTSTVNTVVAASGETPREGDSEVLAAILPAVLGELDGRSGQVLVHNGGWDWASWYSRSLVLQLVRRGIDARMLPSERYLIGDHRAFDPSEPVALRVAIVIDEQVAKWDARPGLRRIARWSSVTDAEVDAFERRAAELDREVERGRLEVEERFALLHEEAPGSQHEAIAWRAAVYVDERAASSDPES